MGLNNEQQEAVVSVLQGDEICKSRILARESSVGQSSRIFCRSAEGVPFRWEMHPGTPKNPQEDGDFIPPICPSPLMQSLGLPLPNLHCDNEDDDTPLKTSKIWRLREMVKKRMGRRSKQQEMSSNFSSPFSTSNRVGDVSMVHAPICCTPRNTPAILDEGTTKIFYCRQHKNAFAVEQDDLSLSKILSGSASASEHFSGPSHGEISPTAGRDKAKKLTLKKAWFWVRHYVKKKESKKKLQHEISLRYKGGMDGEFDGSCLRKSASVSSISPLSKGGWRVSKIRRDFEGRCGPWSRRDVLVFARRKWNSLKS